MAEPKLTLKLGADYKEGLVTLAEAGRISQRTAIVITKAIGHLQQPQSMSAPDVLEDLEMELKGTIEKVVYFDNEYCLDFSDGKLYLRRNLFGDQHVSIDWGKTEPNAEYKGTVTGRFGSKDPNYENLPKEDEYTSECHPEHIRQCHLLLDQLGVRQNGAATIPEAKLSILGRLRLLKTELDKSGTKLPPNVPSTLSLTQLLTAEDSRRITDELIETTRIIREEFKCAERARSNAYARGKGL